MNIVRSNTKTVGHSSTQTAAAEPLESHVQFTERHSPVRLAKGELLRHARAMTLQVARWGSVHWIRALADAEAPIPLRSNLHGRGDPLVLTPHGFKIEVSHWDDCGDRFPRYHSLFNTKLRVQLTLDGLSLRLLAEDLTNKAKERGLSPHPPLTIDPQLAACDGPAETTCSTERKGSPAYQSIPGKFAVHRLALEVGILKRPTTIGLLCPGYSSASWSDFAEAIRTALNFDDCRYFKPDQGYAGRGVFSVTRGRAGSYVFETNCSDTALALRQYPQDAWSRALNIARHTAMSAKKLFSMSASRYYEPASYARLTIPDAEAASSLVSVLTGGQPTVVEDRIPMERMRGARAEFRIVFEQGWQDKVIQLRGHYAKHSSAEVCGNISVLGVGITSDEAISGLVKNRWSRLYGAACDEKSNDVKHEMFDACERFLEGYIRRTSGVPGTIAIDVVPVYNPASDTFDWYLLEMCGDNLALNGRQIGISGMKSNPYLFRNVQNGAG